MGKYSHLETLYRLQEKKAIRTVYTVGFKDHTNTLFLKAKNHQLRNNIQNMFANQEGGYNLGRNSIKDTVCLYHIKEAVYYSKWCDSVEPTGRWNKGCGNITTI